MYAQGRFPVEQAAGFLSGLFFGSFFRSLLLLSLSPTSAPRGMIRAGATAAREFSYVSTRPASRSMSRTPARCCFSSISRPRTSAAPVLAHRPPSTIVKARRRISTDDSGSHSTQGRPRRRWAPVAAGAGLLTAGFGYFATREDAPTLGGDRWTTVKIKSVTPISPETSLFRLEVPKSVLPSAFSSDPTARPILSLYVKEPSLQIQRAYTVSSSPPPLSDLATPADLPGPVSREQPLSATSFDSTGPAELDLVVKRYHDGELSRYIHRLGPGSELHVRGPSVTWWYRTQDWDEVVFVSSNQCSFQFHRNPSCSPELWALLCRSSAALALRPPTNL